MSECYVSHPTMRASPVASMLSFSVASTGITEPRAKGISVLNTDIRTMP